MSQIEKKIYTHECVDYDYLDCHSDDFIFNEKFFKNLEERSTSPKYDFILLKSIEFKIKDNIHRRFI